MRRDTRTLFAPFTQLSKKERELVQIQDQMFSSPFYRPSNEFLLPQFVFTLSRNQDLLNKDMILKMWNSNNDKLRKILKKSMREAIITARIAAGDIYENLGKIKIYQAMPEASRENEEIGSLIENELRSQMLL